MPGETLRVLSEAGFEAGCVERSAITKGFEAARMSDKERFFFDFCFGWGKSARIRSGWMAMFDFDEAFAEAEKNWNELEAIRPKSASSKLYASEV